jgi:hypothetical protein
MKEDPSIIQKSIKKYLNNDINNTNGIEKFVLIMKEIDKDKLKKIIDNSIG